MLAAPFAPRRARTQLLVVGLKSDAERLSAELADEAVDVIACEDSARGLLLAGRHRPDAVLVAATAPDVDSATLIRVLCGSAGIPVLLGVADGDGELAARALVTGATACVARPYRSREVLRMLHGLRPETLPVVEPPTRAGGLYLDPSTHEIRLYGRCTVLPPREFRLLQLLVTHANRVVTREQIHAAVWGSSARDTTNTITVHIQRLRARLDDDPYRPAIIHTVRRVGYRLVPPPHRAPTTPPNGTG